MEKPSEREQRAPVSTLETLEVSYVRDPGIWEEVFSSWTSVCPGWAWEVQANTINNQLLMFLEEVEEENNRRLLQAADWYSEDLIEP